MSDKDKTIFDELVSGVKATGKKIAEKKYKETAQSWLQYFHDSTETIKKIAGIIAVFSFGLAFVVAYSDPSIVQLILVSLNLIVLAIWLYKAKSPELVFRDEQSKIEYYKNFKITSDDTIYVEKAKEIAETNNTRVNKLVVQLNIWIFCYALSLVIVYTVFFIDNVKLWKLLGWDSNLYSFWHYYFKIIEDVFNFISALFLYLGFKVLYNRTLTEDNKPKKYYLDGVIVSALFIFAYLVFSLPSNNLPQNRNLPSSSIAAIGNISANYSVESEKVSSSSIEKLEELANSKNESKATLMVRVKKIADDYERDVNQKATASMRETIIEYEKGTNTIVLNIFGLLIGLANGIAMALLFGRYISLEHLVEDRKDDDYYTIFTLGTVFLLPVYALAQPLFGSFEINAFGDARVFANIVFFICLLGKIFFLYFTFKLMEDRSLHYYLHLIRTSHDKSKELDKFFKSGKNKDSEKNENHRKNNDDSQSGKPDNQDL